MVTRALTFTEACELPGMLAPLVSRVIAEGGSIPVNDVLYVGWFDVAQSAIEHSTLPVESILDAYLELERLIAAAE